ncbi:glycosyltransferase [Aetokthonos hydrillicola Thurmond2011]|jgi:GT2 family glycosyltransferase|uniref:Glycosyltransferase n=1 Tax=Aetokthonos hydrillicola Thurmond2011 TaxID=2712845 RepID=A0AAP5IFE4_9CYAN|nr:glycosyltransferase [Aetokthonos hydrillicola]MBO3461307.1 glycosyltransferase family 2 protein [Aetokthonos hydrillicola CCALA 1050]MBW4589645.1 glycosyltransferase [Aetokthonos hydrillicola CCALA 1050]MDR9899142.1 glycosyltransferase [Aetokthonos hydrillicola Thurmond2011]
MLEKFNVSVCICTRNRPENLKKALDSLEKSTYPIFETIVSDDSTNTDTENLINSSYPNIKYLPGPRLGLGANRNNALKAVTGSHVLFIDDDVVLGEKFLETIFTNLETYTKHGEDISNLIITGPQLDHGYLMFPNDQDFLGFQRITYKEGEPLKTVVINSAVFPASVFQKVLFDEKLVYGCDEVDFTTRAVKAGYRIKLCSEAVNLHLPSLINRDFYKPYHEASRIYVTFKRYFSTEKNKLKALLYLPIASAHTTARTLKVEGIKGLPKAMHTFRLVSSYVTLEYFPSK